MSQVEAGSEQDMRWRQPVPGLPPQVSPSGMSPQTKTYIDQVAEELKEKVYADLCKNFDSLCVQIEALRKDVAAIRRSRKPVSAKG